MKRFPIEYQISIRAMKRRWPIAELATVETPRAGGESNRRFVPDLISRRTSGASVPTW